MLSLYWLYNQKYDPTIPKNKITPSKWFNENSRLKSLLYMKNVRIESTRNMTEGNPLVKKPMADKT